MQAPNTELQDNLKLTIKDLEIHPKIIDTIYMGSDLRNLIFLPCCDQGSSSLLFDKICSASRKLGVRPNIERYISFDADRPLIIIAKEDFKLLFNISSEKIHALSQDEKQSLFEHLLDNRSLLGPDQSLRAILNRLTMATNPQLSEEELTEWANSVLSFEEANKTESIEQKQKNSGDLSPTSYTPGFFQGHLDDSKISSEASPQDAASAEEKAEVSDTALLCFESLPEDDCGTDHKEINSSSAMQV